MDSLRDGSADRLRPSASPAATSVPRAFYGIVPGGGLTKGSFSRMGADKVGSLRFLISWPFVQPTRHGPFNWTGTDALVGNAAEQQINLLPVLVGTPAYEAHGCGTATCANHIHVSTTNQQHDWKKFVRAAVSRYGPHGLFWDQNPNLPYDPISEWQIWNEQNQPKQRNTARDYAKLLSISDYAVHSADPLGKIIMGGMAGTPHGARSKGGISAWSYLSLLYRDGAGKHFDAVALHPYAPKTPGVTDQIKRIRGIMKANHDGSTPILITEIGWGSSKKRNAETGSRLNVGAKLQARNLTNSFRLLTGHRRAWRIGGVFWYSWQDPKNPPASLCAFCFSSGLYRADGRPKPALRAYKKFTRMTTAPAPSGTSAAISLSP